MFTPAKTTLPPINQGATYDLPVTIKDDAGDPLDVSDWKFRMQIREEVASADPLAVFAWNGDADEARIEFETDGTDGKLRIIMPSTLTDALPTGDERQTWAYDLEMYDDSVDPEYVERVMEGTVQVRPEVTRVTLVTPDPAPLTPFQWVSAALGLSPNEFFARAAAGSAGTKPISDLALALLAEALPKDWRELLLTSDCQCGVFDTRNEFISVVNQPDWSYNNSNGSNGIPNPYALPHNRLGVIQPGFTAANGRWLVSSGGIGNVLLLGQGQCTWYDRLTINTLSSSSDRYIHRSGPRHTGVGPTAPIDGVYWEYSDDINGGKWRAVCRANNVETGADTGVTVQSGYDYRRRIEVAADGSRADFYLVGQPIAAVTAAEPVLVATITTNIPQGDAERRVGYAMEFNRTSGSSALPAIADVDYARLRYEFTVPRG